MSRLQISSRAEYTLRLKCCGIVNFPPLTCLARPVLSATADYRIGQLTAGPSIQPASYNVSILFQPYITTTNARKWISPTLGPTLTVNGGSPLLKQQAANTGLSFANYEYPPLSTFVEDGNTIVEVIFRQGLQFTNTATAGNYKVPRDVIFGNTPSSYLVDIFSGPATLPTIYFSASLVITIGSQNAARSNVCDSFFYITGQSPSQSGMGGSGGGI